MSFYDCIVSFPDLPKSPEKLRLSQNNENPTTTSFYDCFRFLIRDRNKKNCPCWLIYIAKQYLFVCCYLSLPRNFHSHGDVTIICEGLHSSTLAVIEQWRFLSVPHLLRRRAFIFKVISEKPMTFTSLDERRAVKIGLSLDRGQDSNPELSASEAIEK